MKHELPTFALLIDADNDSPDIIGPVIEEITRYGRISVRRIYGDFTTPHLAGWREKIAFHGIHPIQQFRNTVGKNASDSALIIDAMDLLHGGKLDGFCLVSSDGDFTRLATRIRENGLTVFGFGRKKAPQAFVNACERYIYVENLINPPEVVPLLLTPTPVPLPAKAPEVDAAAPETAPQTPRAPVNKGSPNTEHAKLNALLSRAYTNVADEDGWALLSRIAQYLRANHSDFDPRNHGASNFVKLLQSVPGFELAQRKQGNGSAHFCRPRQRKTEYAAAMKTAVEATKQADGWSTLMAIGKHLGERGYRLEQSGYASLSDALQGCRLFDMRDVGGARKDFRLAQKTP